MVLQTLGTFPGSKRIILANASESKMLDAHNRRRQRSRIQHGPAHILIKLMGQFFRREITSGMCLQLRAIKLTAMWATRIA